MNAFTPLFINIYAYMSINSTVCLPAHKLRYTFVCMTVLFLSLYQSIRWQPFFFSFEIKDTISHPMLTANKKYQILFDGRVTNAIK